MGERERTSKRKTGRENGEREREMGCVRMDRDSTSQEDFIMYPILVFIDFATFVFQCF